MAELGIDVGRNLATSNDEIRALGVTWVRAPITADASVDDLRFRVNELRRDGIKTVFVIDRSALGDMTPDAAADQYGRSYADLVGAFEVGNEADAGWNFGSPTNSAAARRQKRLEEGGPGFEEPSWIMDPAELTELLGAFRARLPGLELWSGGLCCGQPEFLDSPGLDLSAADGVAIHPYGKDAVGAREMLHRYASKLESQPWGAGFRKPASLVVTEFGFPSAAGSEDSERDQAAMIGSVADALVTHPRLHAAILFCYDNNQDVGGFGLKAGTREKPAFGSYQRMALGLRPARDTAPA